MDPIVGAIASRTLRVFIGLLSCLLGRFLYRDSARSTKAFYGDMAPAVPQGLARVTFRSLGVAATIGGSYLILVALVPSRLLGISFAVSMTILFGCLIGGVVFGLVVAAKTPYRYFEHLARLIEPFAEYLDCFTEVCWAHRCLKLFLLNVIDDPIILRSLDSGAF